MHLEIITPDKTIFEGEVDSATFPGSKGSFQVLKNHAAIISSLDRGKVSYKIKDKEEEIVVNGGIVEVLNNNIVLLAEEIIEA
jgi:F-type H+-transporting ATPase subunit epsilon